MSIGCKNKKGAEKACLHSAQLVRRAWRDRQSLREIQASMQKVNKDSTTRKSASNTYIKNGRARGYWEGAGELDDGEVEL